MEHAEKTSTSHVLQTPIWMVIIRGFQFLLSLIIVGLAGRLMHDLYLDEFGLSVATVRLFPFQHFRRGLILTTTRLFLPGAFYSTRSSPKRSPPGKLHTMFWPLLSLMASW